jgi:hypothetical protein
MRPIPGDIIGIGGVDIAGWRGHSGQGFAIGWLVIKAVTRPKAVETISAAVMPERLPGRVRHRTRRAQASATCDGRPGKCRGRRHYERRGAEGGDQRPVCSIRHSTHQFVGYQAPPDPKLGRPFRARKPILNY